MEGGLRTADEWIRLGREMAQAGVLFLLLTGGEPLLFPDFRKLYKELKSMGMILTINTNGTLLDEEWADFFGRYKPRRINITLYGSNDAAYENLCHYHGGFSRTLKAIRLLREQKVDVKINGSVTKLNRDDMDAIYQIGRNLDIPVHMDTYMLPGIHERGLPFEHQSRLMPEDAAAADIRMREREMETEAFVRYAEETVAHTEKKDVLYPAQITCLAGNCSFAISWRGEMRPCVTFQKPLVPVFDMGFEAAWTEISRNAKSLKVSDTCVTCVEMLRPDLVYRTNTSGVRGVYYSSRRNKWIAQIMFRQKCYYLGGYDKIEDAAEARAAAEEKIFGDFLKWYEEEYPGKAERKKQAAETGI